MSGDTDPRDGDFEQAAIRLTEGLESCRSVLNDYRSMIGKAANDTSPESGSQSGSDAGSES